MADLIGLINDISTSVKLEWIGVLAWGAVQFVWYRRARVLPGTVEAASSISSSFPSVTGPPDTEPIELPAAEVQGIAAAEDLDVIETPGPIRIRPACGISRTRTPRKRSTRRRRATTSSGSSAVPT